MPPSLLETTEATEVLHPIMEWGRALPKEVMADVEPHPFRRNGLTSACPAWLGRDDPRSHFTFCSELGRDDPRSHFTFCSESNKRPVPGLNQIWFTLMTLERAGLRRMFVDDSGLWERYFYDEVEVEKRREDERRNVLATGLPSPPRGRLCRRGGVVPIWKTNAAARSKTRPEDLGHSSIAPIGRTRRLPSRARRLAANPRRIGSTR